MSEMLKSCPCITRYEHKPVLTGDQVPYASALVFNAGVIRWQGQYAMVFRNDYNYVRGSSFEGTNIGIGAQNMHQAEKGAFTGEVSGEMLKAIGVTYVVLGHSERREYYAETDAGVNEKTIKALALGLTPIVCCGETLEEREAGNAEAKVVGQIQAGLKDIDDITKVIIAYEPIWAIGTGKTASKEEADEACGWVRKTIADMYGQDAADAVRVQYGGSVKPANAAELMAMDNIDGALVGGASLTADFAKIVKY